MYSNVMLDDVIAGLSINVANICLLASSMAACSWRCGLFLGVCARILLSVATATDSGIEEDMNRASRSAVVAVIRGTKNVRHGCDSWLLPEASGG